MYIVQYSTGHMTILSKEEKVEEELHQVLGQGVGLITGIVFCLRIDGDTTKRASKSGGGGVPKHFKLGL